MRMPRIAMEPAGVVVARVRSMSLARNVGPAAPAVNFMTQFARGRMRPSRGWGDEGPHEGTGGRAHPAALALHRDEHDVPDPVLPGRSLLRGQAGEGGHRGGGP